MKRLISILLINIFLAGTTFTASAAAPILYLVKAGMSGGGWYSTISDALSESPDGAHILVYPGTYTENIVFEQGQDLISIFAQDPNNKPTIKASSGVAITIHGENNLLSNLKFGNVSVAVSVMAGSNTIENCNFDATITNFAIYVDDQLKHVKVSNCNFTSKYGVRLGKTTENCDVLNCVFINSNGKQAVWNYGNPDELDSCNLIKGCTIDGFEEGVLFKPWYPDAIIVGNIENCLIKNTTKGVHATVKVSPLTETTPRAT